MHLMVLGAFCPHVVEQAGTPDSKCLNTPYGARCFLTPEQEGRHGPQDYVLMHLMALGAF